MFAHRDAKFAPRRLSCVHESAIGVQRKFRIHGQDAVAAAHNSVDNIPGGIETVLSLVCTARERILQQAFQDHFAEYAAGFRATQNVVQGLRRLRHLLAR